MKNKKFLITIAVFFLLNIAACAQQNSKNEMTTSELILQMKNDTSLVILDVRTPEELKGPLGQIENIINIPAQELAARINELSNCQERNIAVICRSGNRSRTATSLLIEKGFKSKNVLGGMIQFRDMEKQDK